MNIAVAQSGGPTCAINASLAGVFNAGKKSGKINKIFGVLNGIEGIINDQMVDLSEKIDSDVSYRGYLLPTETEEGYSGDAYCNFCGGLVMKGAVLPAQGSPSLPGSDPAGGDPTGANSGESDSATDTPEPTDTPTPTPEPTDTPTPTPAPTSRPLPRAAR